MQVMRTSHACIHIKVAHAHHGVTLGPSIRSSLSIGESSHTLCHTVIAKTRSCVNFVKNRKLGPIWYVLKCWHIARIIHMSLSISGITHSLSLSPISLFF